MNTLYISLIILASSVVISFFYGLITRNYSTVDRLWSVLPPIYVLIWFAEIGFSIRYIIPMILVILWGARLTANFAIKDGYSFSFSKGFTGEDYRWEILRDKIPNRFLFELFNLVFISSFQLGLIFLFTLPLYYYGQIEGQLQWFEIMLFIIQFALLALETLADIQQLRYYNRRDLKPWSDHPRYKLGFNTFGLWKYSRHPNYVCEFSQWIVVALYLITAGATFHFSAIGAIALTALFIGSTVFTESITLEKYPKYKEWQKFTSSLLPLKGFFSPALRKEKETFLNS